MRHVHFFLICLWSVCVCSAPAQKTPKPSFSLKPGFYKGEQKLVISPTVKGKILYTLNGDVPVPGGPKVQTGNPGATLLIDRNTVVRARTLPDGTNAVPGPVETATYILNDKVALPVVCVTIPPDSLFGETRGIYSLYYYDFETPGHLEFFQVGKGRVYDAELEFSVAGSASRSLAKKSFKVMARGKIGPKMIRFPFFPDVPVDSFKGILLRADATTGVGRPIPKAGERLRNETVYWLNREMGSNVEMQAYLPVVMYLNGKYWGQYTIMERKDANFIFNHSGEKDIDLIDAEDLYVEEGDKQHYMQTLYYMNHHDLNQTEVWDSLNRLIDMNSFIDYWVLNTYTAAFDFEVNIRFWRPRKAGGKWRWISYDNDSWGESDHEFFYEITEEDSARRIFLMNRMMQGKFFREAFINRLADCLNTVLLPENVTCWIDMVRAPVRLESSRDRARWEGEVKYVFPGADYDYLTTFADERPEYIREHVIGRYDLPGIAEVQLDVSPAGAGLIQLNTITPQQYPWSGKYFQGIGCKAKPIANPGYVFDHWEGSMNSTNAVLTFDPAEGRNIKAVFRKKQ